MAKFAAVLSLLLVLAVCAAAHRTVTTTVVVEEESNRPGQCRERVQKMDFDHCMQFLGGSGGGRQMLRSIVGQGGQMSEHLQPCCQQLKKAGEECQCDAAGFVIQEQERKMGGQGGGSAEMKVVESLMLAECGLLKCEQQREGGGQQGRF